RVRAGVGSVRHHHALHVDRDPYLPAVGPLPGRRDVPIATVAGHRPLVTDRDRVRPPVTSRQLPPGVRRRRLLTSVANHSLAIAFSIIFLAPFLFVVLTALMTLQQALSTR